MTNKKLEQLWDTYPKSHLHCDVTVAGQNSYRIVASLITDAGEIVATVENYGSGDLDFLKEQTFNTLAEQLQQVSKA
jgi:hypothetical protein